MTSGAVIVALLGLGVGCAGMWLAWRLVRAAGGESRDPAKASAQGQSGAAADEEHEQPASEEPSLEDSPAGVFSPTGAWGQIGAVLALGGVCLLIPALFNLASTWPLAVGGLVAIAVGLALLLLLHKHQRNPAAKRDGTSESAEPR